MARDILLPLPEPPLRNRHPPHTLVPGTVIHRIVGDTKLLDSVLDMRNLMEVEIAGLAAKNRTQDHLKEMVRLLKAEEKVDPRDLNLITNLDFSLHHTIAMASENMIYPLIMNSFKAFYMSLAKRSFSSAEVTPFVFSMHTQLVAWSSMRASHPTWLNFNALPSIVEIGALGKRLALSHN